MRIGSSTFAGGVIGPGLYGRVDLNKYQTGLKKAENMVIAVEGGADKRFGMYLVGKRKFQDKKSKLRKWYIGPEDSYMLEFGDLYIRFIRLGGYVSIPSGHVALPGNNAANVGGFMEVTTPYTQDEIAQLDIKTANDVMYIAHPNHQTRQLSRLGLYDWKFELFSFDAHPAFSGTVSGTWNNTTTSGDNYVPEPVPTSYRVSATLADGTETKPSPVFTLNADTGHRRCWVSLTWTAVPNAIQYTIYKGKNGIFGFIGYTTTLTYDDRNFAPSYDVVPIGDPIPFQPVGAPAEWPARLAFYKQRLAFGRTKSQTQALWFSRPLLFNSLTKSLPLQDDDAIKATLVGETSHTINHMVQLKKFLIFTSSGEWVVGTDNNAALTTATLNPVLETSYGSDPELTPISIGERILFVQNITGAVLDMGYEYTSDAFKADELTRLVRELFKKKSIEAWDYAAFPQNILPCVLDTGTVNVMTYVREHEIWGWATASTQGKYLDICAVPEAGHTGVYYQVERVINGIKTYFIERTEINFTDRIEDMVYLDCALTYKDEATFTSLARVDDTTIMFTADDGYAPGMELQLEFEGSSEYLRVEITSVVGTTITATVLRKNQFPENLPSTGISYRCASVISGLNHLEGETVKALADAKVVNDLVVSGGSVTIPFRAARIHVGLPYEAELETLDMDDPRAAGTYEVRAINEIILNLRNSRGVFAGPSASDQDLVLIDPRNQENMYEANSPLDGPYRIPSHVAWEMNCGVKVRSVDPLPLNVSNIVPDIIYGY